MVSKSRSFLFCSLAITLCFVQTNLAEAAVPEAGIPVARTGAMKVLSQDSADRVSKFRDEDGHDHACTYDPQGRLIRLVRAEADGRERQTLFAFDADDRIAIVQYSTGYRIHFDYPDATNIRVRDNHGNLALLSPTGDRADARAPDASQSDRLAVKARAAVDLLRWLHAQGSSGP